MIHAIQSVITLESVSAHTGISLIELHQFVRHRERYYSTFRIPKNSGGYRKIQAPCGKLKVVQRWIATALLGAIPLPDACTGYRRGHSIVTNAAPHAGADFVFNVDIARFFPSISESRVRQLFLSLGHGEKVARALTALTTVNGALPQGAPSSPAIANLICGSLDERMQSFASQHGWSYTRYCDDITISGRGHFRRLRRTVFDIIESEGFEVNLDKVRFASSGQRQEVTGLVVNSFVNVPRERRRIIRAMLHRHAKESSSQEAVTSQSEAPADPRLVPEQLSPRLTGLLSFIKMVHPQDRLLCAPDFSRS